MIRRDVRSVCPYCGVGCGIVMTVEGDRVIKVSGDKSHPSNFGRLCTKGSTCAEAIVGTGRLDVAHVRQRRGRDQIPTPVDAAIAETGRRLAEIRDAHGPDAIAFYVSGQMSLEAQYLANKLAKGFIRTRHIESNSRLCMASASSGYKLSLGADAPPGSYDDFERADLFFVVGSNMADCHPILFLRMMDRVRAGAKLIVVDPRRTAVADKADLFLQIRPGADLALLNGLLRLIVEAGGADEDFIAEFTEGWEAVAASLSDYPPDRVAALTGLAEADILKAAELIVAAPEWMSCWTMGLNQSSHGVWNSNAICNLHLATGKICRPGSGPFSLTGQPNAMGGREMGYMGPGLPGQRSLLVESDRRFVEELWRIPEGSLRAEGGGGVITLFEDMRDGAIKACWIICTNPVATVANRQTVIDALKAAELVVTQDAFLDTETNIYADIMLPGALWAEAEGVMVNSERNMTLAAKAVEPPGEALPDWLIIARVAAAMGYGEAFAYASASEVFDEIARASNPKTGYDIRGASHARLCEGPLQWPVAGPGASARNPIRYLNDGVSQTLLEAPDGRRPALAFATASGRAAFFARPHVEPVERPDADFPFILNNGRLQHQWHTLTKTGKIAALNRLNPGPFVEINPRDAAALGLAEGERVEIRSRRGKAALPARVTERVRPGDCFAPFHWNDVFGDELAVNALTGDAVDPFALQPEFKVCAVALARARGEGASPVVAAEKSQTGEVQTPVSASSSILASGGGTPSAVQALSRYLGLEIVAPPPLEPHERLYLQGFLAGLCVEEAPAAHVPALPATAPLEPQKRLILDGLLAGLFSRGAAPSPGGLAADGERAATESAIAVLWASQTGNAEEAAAQCAKRLEAEGYAVRLTAMDAYRSEDLAGERSLLICASTFGDGDPPDNGVAFWEALRRTDFPRLERLSYAVLAFGDSSYGEFCSFGRKLDARLEALGARRLAERGDVEPDGEATAEAWRGTVAGALEQLFAKAAAPAAALVAASIPPARENAEAAPEGSRRGDPHAARLVLNRVLNAPGGGKETRHYGLALREGRLAYEAGDALGVWPTNCPNLVAEILGALRLGGNERVRLDNGETTLADALIRRFEICRVTPDFLRWWSDRSKDETLKNLLAAGGDALADWLWGRQIADVIQMSSAAVGAGELVAALKKLQPRLYSIASSPKRCPGEAHLAVVTVRYACEGRARGGVSSTFLADRAGDAEIGIFVQPTAHFRPPADPDAPMIMVGPGAGIAPFRGFLQEREETGARGRNWLFFGERRAISDFYYRDELERWRADGHLARLDTAFSRDQERKIYVQHRMIEQGGEIWRWLEGGASFYVCGGAGRMAKDVDAALKEIVRVRGGMTAERAAAYVSGLAKSRRYLRDVY